MDNFWRSFASPKKILAVSELGSLAVTEWFHQRLPVRPTPSTSSEPGSEPAPPIYASAIQQIDAWNHIALNLGREGFPMAERLPIALSITYKHLQGKPFATVFEVLEADEHGP